MEQKRNPETGETMYLVRNDDNSLTEASHIWRGRSGVEMEATEEEIDRQQDDEPTLM